VNIVTVITAATNGTQIREVNIKATGNTSLSSLVLFLNDGTNFYVLTEISVSAITASTTTASYSSSVRFDNLFLPTNWSLRASMTVAPATGGVTVTALGADL
jgi:hypothetical protein